MPKPSTTQSGAPCWIDLLTSDPDASRAFYGELFGWTSEDAGEQYGGYISFARQGVPVAGGMRNDGTAGTPDVWSVYLVSDDAKATVDAAEAAGGKVLVPAMDVTDLGVMAMVADVGGAAIGIWQPGLHRGFGVVAEPGAPAWFELHTREYDAAVRFYQEVFGWETEVVSDAGGFRYTTLGSTGDQQAGVMDASELLPEGVPAHWSVYFSVADTDASLERIVELGGSVVLAPKDTPYGRLAAAADPTGAGFKVIAGS